MLFIPHCRLALLSDDGPADINPRNMMTSEIRNHYLKTASEIAGRPWAMKKAAAYLENWCDMNENGVNRALWPVKFVFGNDRLSDKHRMPKVENFAPHGAKQVQLVTCKSLKRKQNQRCQQRCQQRCHQRTQKDDRKQNRNQQKQRKRKGHRNHRRKLHQKRHQQRGQQNKP